MKKEVLDQRVSWVKSWKKIEDFLDTLAALELRSVWDEEEDEFRLPGFLERRGVINPRKENEDE